jgi:hypothetical protein
MGFLDKAKAAAEQAAAKAKEGVEDVQTKRELSQAHVELGKAAFELIESGELQNDRLQAIADRIRSLNERLEADGDDGQKGEEPVAAASDQPPAMPT